MGRRCAMVLMPHGAASPRGRWACFVEISLFDGAERACSHPPLEKLRHFSTYSKTLRVDTVCRGAPTGVLLSTGGGVLDQKRITH